MGMTGDELVYLRVNEWCIALDSTRATAYRKIERGELRTVRIGPRSLRIVVRASELIDTESGSPSPTIGDIRAALKKMREQARESNGGSSESSKRNAGARDAAHIAEGPAQRSKAPARKRRGATKAAQ